MHKKDFVSGRGVGGLVGWNELKTQSRARSLVGTVWRCLVHGGSGCGDEERVLGARRTLEKRWAHVDMVMGTPAGNSTFIPYGGPTFVTSSPRATTSGSKELCLVCHTVLPKKVCGSPGQRASTFIILRRVLGD